MKKILQAQVGDQYMTLNSHLPKAILAVHCFRLVSITYFLNCVVRLYDIVLARWVVSGTTFASSGLVRLLISAFFLVQPDNPYFVQQDSYDPDV